MSTHEAIIRWKRSGPDFRTGRYSREHTWTFDGGVTVPASPSPSVVPAPYSNAAGVDPEEAFVAAVSSCHMLTFLHLASRAGLEIDSYEDTATGSMTKNEKGVPWISEITLRPRIRYAEGARPTPDVEQRLHHEAHEQCFISSSIKTRVNVDASAGPA